MAALHHFQALKQHLEWSGVWLPSIRWTKPCSHNLSEKRHCQYPPLTCHLPFHPFFLLPRDFSLTSYLALSGLVLSLADINLNSPNKGLLSDSMTDVPVDTAVAAQTPAVESLTEAEEEELRAELMKVLCLGLLFWGTMS